MHSSYHGFFAFVYFERLNELDTSVLKDVISLHSSPDPVGYTLTSLGIKKYTDKRSHINSIDTLSNVAQSSEIEKELKLKGFIRSHGLPDIIEGIPLERCVDLKFPLTIDEIPDLSPHDPSKQDYFDWLTSAFKKTIGIEPLEYNSEGIVPFNERKAAHELYFLKKDIMPYPGTQQVMIDITYDLLKKLCPKISKKKAKEKIKEWYDCSFRHTDEKSLIDGIYSMLKNRDYSDGIISQFSPGKVSEMEEKFNREIRLLFNTGILISQKIWQQQLS